MGVLVVAVGALAATPKINNDEAKAAFTLCVGNDRYYVVTVGLEQLRLATLLQPGSRVLLLGSSFTFRGACGQHHVGIEPQILLPANGLEAQEIALLQEVTIQWITSSVSSFIA